MASIDPEGFYIYNLPGPLELATLSRPHVRIEQGVVRAYQPPSNLFSCAEDVRLLLFDGKEPNLDWRTYADCILSYAEQTGTTTLYFLGGVGGLVPHSRQPRLIGSVSHERLAPWLEHCGIALANYEGPGSFATYLMSRAADHGLAMAGLVVETPAYVQGANPKCIEAVLRKLSALLETPFDVSGLRAQADEWERRINEVLKQKPELAGFISKLEEDYDNEVFDNQMGDLKTWLREQGIRLD